MKRLFRFLKDARTELKKVSWPTWDEVTRSTVIVFVACILFTLFVFAADLGVDKVIKGILR